ncbi:MAG TPA: helix-turn-helix domain-containing protein [Vicinamibacterales bacterium]|nr:helix-turn-helix domain-containing protein [Vicinamibacterales bacterium]
MRTGTTSGARTALVTLQQAAEETGVPYTSVRDLVVRGFLPRVQLGDSRRIWVRRSDLDRLIAASTAA